MTTGKKTPAGLPALLPWASIRRVMSLPKSARILSLAGAVFALAGCAAPAGESWPTVSFGGAIAANEAARTAPYQVALSPLPALTEEQRAGAENPAQFLPQLEAEYAALGRRIFERKADYSSFRQGLEGVSPEQRFGENWLSAQMELSNISQTTERLKTIRAQIMLLGNPPPEAARALLKKVEALELENRLFVRDEMAFLDLNDPTGS